MRTSSNDSIALELDPTRSLVGDGVEAMARGIGGRGRGMSLLDAT